MHGDHRKLAADKVKIRFLEPRRPGRALTRWWLRHFANFWRTIAKLEINLLDNYRSSCLQMSF